MARSRQAGRQRRNKWERSDRMNRGCKNEELLSTAPGPIAVCEGRNIPGRGGATLPRCHNFAAPRAQRCRRPAAPGPLGDLAGEDVTEPPKRRGLIVPSRLCILVVSPSPRVLVWGHPDGADAGRGGNNGQRGSVAPPAHQDSFRAPNGDHAMDSRKAGHKIYPHLPLRAFRRRLPSPHSPDEFHPHVVLACSGPAPSPSGPCRRRRATARRAHPLRGTGNRQYGGLGIQTVALGQV